MNLALKSPVYCAAFAKLGESWDVSEKLLSDLGKIGILRGDS